MNEKDRKEFKERFYKEAERKGIEVNAEYEQALQSLLLGENLFVSGMAGSGKSEFVQLLRDTYKGNMVVTATTGIASASVRGVTLHSLFSLPLKAISKQTEFDKIAKKITNIPEKYSVIKNTNLLIIDEVSMAKCYHIDAINSILKSIKEIEYKQFGGVQVILIGDLMQLPPVLDNKSYEPKFLEENYQGNPFFFNSTAYRNGNFKFVMFNKIYRQNNKEFQNALNRFRTMTFDDSDLAYINQRVVSEEEFFEEGDYIYLSSINRTADEVNETWLETLDGDRIYLDAEIKGKSIKSNIPEKIVVKPEAQVMMLRNNPQEGYYNGTIGIFKEIRGTGDDRYSIIEVDGENVKVDLYEEEHIKYTYDKDTNEVKEEIIGRKVQFPFKLSFALSVHKSQGLSLDRAFIDLGRKAFASGQAYVALSRIRTLEGLALKRPLKAGDFIENEHLIKFIEENS